jgi:hypothetical protein
MENLVREKETVSENNYRPIQRIIEQIRMDAKLLAIASGGRFLLNVD